MGAAASLMEVDGNVELSEAIKAEYERLKGEGATDEAIEVQLKEKFSEPSATKPSAPISDAGQKLDSRAKTRKTIVVQKPVQPKGGGGRDKIRRRVIELNEYIYAIYIWLHHDFLDSHMLNQHR